MSNAALRAAYVEAMQGAAPPSAASPATKKAESIPNPPSTETPASSAAAPTHAAPTPGPSVSPANDLPVLGGIDLSKLNLSPEQIAALADQTRMLKAEDALTASEAQDTSVDNGEPSPIPVTPAEGRRGVEPKRESAAPAPALDAETQAELEQYRALRGFLAETPEAVSALADLAAKKARGEGQPVETPAPKKLSAEQFAELSHEEQIAYVHQQAVADTTRQLLPVLQRLEAGIRDIKQGEQDRFEIAEKHQDFASLPKDHHLRGLVDDLRREMPSLTLVQAVEKAKALAAKFTTGAKREIQATQARSATVNVHKPETAQTRELELNPREMKTQGKSRREILDSIFQNELRKRGVDV